METIKVSLALVCCLALTSAGRGRGFEGGEVKPGHYSIKEFHFHIYFRYNFFCFKLFFKLTIL